MIQTMRAQDNEKEKISVPSRKMLRGQQGQWTQFPNLIENCVVQEREDKLDSNIVDSNLQSES